MRASLSMRRKIWLSLGVFVAGYVTATLSGQLHGARTERALRITAEALFPAAQSFEKAEAAFQRAVKGFSDAVMTQDATKLDQAAEEGSRTIERLKSVAALSGLEEGPARVAGELASAVTRFTADARAVYGSALGNASGITAESQSAMRELAERTASIEKLLGEARDRSAQELHGRLQAAQEQSVRQRRMALWLFGATLGAAVLVVNWTIRRAIVAPVVRVTQGIENAAARTSQAADRVATSGQAVARDAGDQAACLAETSSALEEISTTTKQNANRATEADGLMRRGRETVDSAVEAMDHLARSIGAIRTSSSQVASVLRSIDEIAFHTNILALNAAVEAARAGEAGAGFSVVADEVRSLAHRAAEAARQSSEIVESTIADVAKGVELTGQAQEAFRVVAETISRSGQAVSEIAASSVEQARGIEHIGAAVARADRATQNNAATAQHTAENASALTDQVIATRRHIAELFAVIGVDEDAIQRERVRAR